MTLKCRHRIRAQPAERCQSPRAHARPLILQHPDVSRHDDLFLRTEPAQIPFGVIPHPLRLTEVRQQRSKRKSCRASRR